MSHSPASIQFDQYGSPITTVSGTDGVRLGVNATISGSLPLPSGASQEHVNADSPHAVRLTDGSSFYKATTPADTQPVSVSSLPLPAGAATEVTLATKASEATLSALNLKVPNLGQSTLASGVPVSIASNQTAIPVTDNGGSLTVDASSWPLPPDAATASNQTLELDRLASIDQKTPLLGQGTLASGIPVSIASNQTAIPVTDNSGSLTVDAASWPLPTGASTESTLVTLLSGTTFTSRINTQGQKTMSGSTPVVLASDQTVIPVSDNNGSITVDASSWPLPTGASTSALQVTANNSLASIDLRTPNLGQATLASGIPVSIASNQTAIPVTDNSGSLTVDAVSWPLPTGASTESTLVTLLSGTTFTSRINTFGQKTMANSTPVVISSDQVMPLPTGASTEVTVSGINITLKDIRDTKGIKKIVDPLPAGSNDIGHLRIADGGGSGRLVAVDSANRLVVSANATIVPAASTAVARSAQSDLTGTEDDVYTITNGKILTVSRFAGGAEGNSGKRTKCELYYDPNGNGTGMTLIRAMYLGGTNYEFTLDEKFTGDGTGAIRMRRERLDGAADEVAAFWNGFES